jgi:uncharacterized membrane protein
MKKLFDRIAVSFIGLIALVFIEGICTLGQAFHFEQYNWIGYTIQVMLLYLAVWIANKAYDAENA